MSQTINQPHASGNIYIISAPSGAGKTSLVKVVLKEVNNLELSVSHTTRDKRPGEEEGVDYYFVDKQVYQQMVDKQQFVEHAKVFHNFYGTSSSHIQEDLDKGFDIILEIDWQGAQQVKKHFPDAVSLFVLPPSKSALYERLTSRGQDSEEIIQGRMAQAVSEMQHHVQYDYIIVNDDFDEAKQEIESIIRTHRLENSKQVINLNSLLKELLL